MHLFSLNRVQYSYLVHDFVEQHLMLGNKRVFTRLCFRKWQSLIFSILMSSSNVGNIDPREYLSSLDFDFEVGKVVCPSVSYVENSYLFALVFGLKEQPVSRKRLEGSAYRQNPWALGNQLLTLLNFVPAIKKVCGTYIEVIWSIISTLQAFVAAKEINKHVFSRVYLSKKSIVWYWIWY